MCDDSKNKPSLHLASLKYFIISLVDFEIKPK